MEEMKVRAINLWDEENHFNNTWNVQTISPDDETRYSIQEMFTQVMEQARTCVLQKKTKIIMTDELSLNGWDVDSLAIISCSIVSS